ncbi:Putative Zn-dependent protease, contains TPR repeats [Legionella lansingensis]|uniref:Tetratricopeptide repeat protein n=1 Tax=Legionella lansingensis TaxID=45067 RepID=A0A0W0VJW5_9GAMM|nr:tetratricopeptide repeat protein [Legionella lansingensis]KTD20388.1 Tetratricopeptide repeat protein [Legionella lansingensis]SNV51573.1 Putative Zn-dependent protease, contains TPR repeats [Legionella lansingensis]
MRIKLILFSAMIFCLSQTFAKETTVELQAPLFDNLGSFHFPISTKVSLAQRFFDQGMILFYGFEWGEAIRSFREATRLDPNCAMCYWGLALALGSKMNAPMTGKEYQDARTAIHKAVSLRNFVTETEQDYINALALRFKHLPKPISPGKTGTFSCHTANTSFDKSSPEEMLDYSNAMKKLVKKYPLDNNMKALYAWALFETIEWKFWDSTGKINPVTPEIISVLEAALANDELHVGANHFYIHVIEASPTPELALPNADRLTTLVPGSEHLVHMPSHIYLRTGKYHESTNSNLQAIHAFNIYNSLCRQQGFEPEINYLYFHNYDFLRSTATIEGRKALALSAVQSMLAPPFPDWLKNEPELQWFIPIPYYVKARFGMWKELLAEPKPQDQYQYAVGMWHYGRGMAFVHTKDEAKATDELAHLDKIIASGPADKTLQDDSISLLKIAQAILHAQIANSKGDKAASLASLQLAMKTQQAMHYHEPPDWYFPVTEMLADAYLKWSNPKKAVELYRQTLKQFPNNGWALFGLAKALRALGEDEEANKVDAEFKNAWKYADVASPIPLFN